MKSDHDHVGVVYAQEVCLGIPLWEGAEIHAFL